MKHERIFNYLTFLRVLTRLANDLRIASWKLVHKCKSHSKESRRGHIARITVLCVIYASFDIVLQLKRHANEIYYTCVASFI